MFNNFCRAVVVFVLLVSICIAGGCGLITGQYKQHQKTHAANEALALAQKKYLESLPTCAIVDPLHESDFLFHYRSIVVHIKSSVHYDNSIGGSKADQYMDTSCKNAVKRLLSEKGYKVTLGRNLGEDEFLATTECCSKHYHPAISDKQFEVRHNHPLFIKLIEENSYPESCDAVMFLQYRYGDQASISLQLFDVSTKMIVMSTNNPIEGEKSRKYGVPYNKVIGTKTYLATPYYYTGSDEELLERILSSAFKYMPSWSGGKLVPPEIYNLGGSRNLSTFLIWQDQGQNP
jgi:hypothetical protein